MGKGMRAGKKKKVGGGGETCSSMKQLQAMRSDKWRLRMHVEQETTATAWRGSYC